MVFGVPSTFSATRADIEALTLYTGGNIDMYGLSGSTRLRIYDQGTDTGNIAKLLIATGNDTAGSLSGITFSTNNQGINKGAFYAVTRNTGNWGRVDFAFALNNQLDGTSAASNLSSANGICKILP